MKTMNYFIKTVITILIILSVFTNITFSQENEDVDEKQAIQNFNSIMLLNEESTRNTADGYNKFEEDTIEYQELGLEKGEKKKKVKKTTGSIELPLKTYTGILNKLKALIKDSTTEKGPAVILGSSEYTGKAIKGALSLRLRLQVTLGHKNKWKIIPIVGENVVLVGASVNGKSIPVARKNSYHVWTTKETGEHTIVADILVPAHGPRGSIEYSFHVVHTPITKFSWFFPVKGLEPRLTATVQSYSKQVDNGTRFTAFLRPTAKIHLIGFKDLSREEKGKAKVYSESMNLLSIDENALEMFTVIRYTILYAGIKTFTIHIPNGYEVVSADGMGAFHYVLKKTENETILSGETAFPIRQAYEISLRIKKEFKSDDKTFSVLLPRCREVEREVGWLAVEVPGKLQIEQKQAQNVQILDIRQLPHDMVISAVSPIIKAFRYHTGNPDIQFQVTRLPEIEASAASIDQILAYTKITPKGRMITDLHITLRNRLRHSIALTLPESVKVSSASLDGQPMNLSKDDKGRIILPLKRSTGTTRLKDFTIAIILESQLAYFGPLGYADFFLPTFDLPVSSLLWKLFVPRRNYYSSLKGHINSQKYIGQVDWYRPALMSYSSGSYQSRILQSGHSSSSASGGALPVRFKVPQKGRVLDYTRYWIEENMPLKVSFAYIRTWLLYPIRLILTGLIAFFLVISVNCISSKKKPYYLEKTLKLFRLKIKDKILVRMQFTLYCMLLLLSLLAGWLAGKSFIILSGIIFGLIGILWYKKLHISILKWLKQSIKTFYPTFKPKRKIKDKQILNIAGVSVLAFITFLFLFSIIIKIILILLNPLPG